MTTATGLPPGVQRVLLVGPDDESRRALHLMLDRAGKQVAAMSELDGARRYLAASECDAVIAAPEVAAELARARNGDGGAPVIAVLRARPDDGRDAARRRRR